MIKATTPTLTLTLPQTVDLTSADKVLVTFSQYNTLLTKTLDNGAELVSANVIAVTLTQKETLMFKSTHPASVQVNWIENGSRLATTIGKIIITPNLIPEVIDS